jgi:uncharacterized protein YndB with AHSA1/START domain
MMTVTDVRKDPTALTMTIASEWPAPVERVWRLWADPRKLERWWGPPTYPATVVEHDLRPGGKVTYFMTGPDGEQHHGWWKVIDVDEPRHLALEDGFADTSGNPNADMPTMHFTVSIAEVSSDRTIMVIETHFPSSESMAKLLEMGVEEGMAAAMGQIDAILAGD